MFPEPEHSARRVNRISLNQSCYDLRPLRYVELIHCRLYCLMIRSIPANVTQYIAYLRFVYAFLYAYVKLPIDFGRKHCKKCYQANEQTPAFLSLVNQDDVYGV
jgi:hypothetical protein